MILLIKLCCGFENILGVYIHTLHSRAKTITAYLKYILGYISFLLNIIGKYGWGDFMYELHNQLIFIRYIKTQVITVRFSIGDA